jgi:hypothetical protein
MVLNVSVHDFIRHIGHDGSEISWPSLPEPACRRGFHIQECIELVDRLGFTVTPFEMLPRHAPAFVVPALTIYYGGSEQTAFERIAAIVKRGQGVITGHNNTIGHAVAYDHGIIYDPNGSWYKYGECEKHNFIGYCAWEIYERPRT